MDPIDEYGFIHMRRPVEHRKAKKRNKKDERYLRRLSKQLDLKNSVHSHLRMQQRFSGYKPEEVKRDIMNHLDQCWSNIDGSRFLIIGSHGRYIVSDIGRIITVMDTDGPISGFSKILSKPKFKRNPK